MRTTWPLGTFLLVGCGRVGFDGTVDAELDASASIIASFEAEAGALTPLFEVRLEPGASGGAFLLDATSRGNTGPGQAVFQFELAASGTYYVWARAKAPDLATDSMFVSIDNGTPVNFALADCVNVATWKWAPVRSARICPDMAPIGAFPLGPGPHMLTLSSREGQSAVDLVYVVDDAAFVPAD
jgi:hypothetical protein